MKFRKVLQGGPVGPCTPPVLRIACNFSAVPLGLRHNLTVSNSLRIEVFLVMLKE